MARKRVRKAGDLAAATRVLWRALLTAEDLLDTADAADMQLRAVHAISQACSTYAKPLEAGEAEARLAALEHEVKTLHAERYTPSAS